MNKNIFGLLVKESDTDCQKTISNQTGSPPVFASAKRELIPVLVTGVIVICAIVGLGFRLAHMVPVLIHEADWSELTKVAILNFCLVPLFAGYLYYLLAKYAFWRRQGLHTEASRADIEDVYLRSYSEDDPKLAVLIPSYKEEERTIRQTMMSAALAEYPQRRVMLLIDDPQNPEKASDQACLQAARDLPGQLDLRFRTALKKFQKALAEFEAVPGQMDYRKHLSHLAELYLDAAQTLETWATQEKAQASVRSAGLDHTDHHFIDKILLAPATAHRQRARDLAAASLADQPTDFELLRREYHRLGTMFDVDFGSFERKRYANLSHNANKAMNLNSYLGIMGGTFLEVVRPDGCYLEGCDEIDASIVPPHADYIIILDADSLITSDYALRLTHVLENPGNERIGLIQTPYIAIPNSPITIERVASATTDLHYVVQQGVSHFEAAYWVGPNSLIRRSALDDIMVESLERGHTVKSFIQDLTLIEDTGSTIDLIRKGWFLHNYFDRLAYSATPADFGALLIQRRRWANGGLLLLPALMRYLFESPVFSLRRLVEGYLRVFTLISPTLITIATLILIFSSFDDRVLIWWLPLVAVPYYILLAGDLRNAGYGLRDLPRVYAMNLLLLPIVLGGVFQSLQQAVSRKKVRFARTPKIASRTATPLIYLTACYGIFFFCALSVFGNAIVHRYYNACFSLIFMLAYLYALARYITFQAAFEDLVFALKESLLTWWTMCEQKIFSRKSLTPQENAPLELEQRKPIEVEVIL